MKSNDLRLCRSLLFLPASNPRAIEKARTLACDMVILDLEDAVKAEDKDVARAAAVEAMAQGFGDRMTAIRVNAAGPWREADLKVAGASAADILILPKVESQAEVASAVSAGGKPVLAMIETAKGLLAAPAIAANAAGLIAGTNDLAADLGLPPAAGRGGLAYGLQAIVAAARASGAAAFDGVYNLLDNEAGLARECEEGRSFGFDGKTLIHPNQIATANDIFGPGEEDVEAAKRLIAAATGGAERFEGRMIEAMHVAQAEAVLAKARL